ncbi:hypothetical protein [Agromyces subbeticus]|uniref:hypothetical protein n=1 Tax=Agromyces subbeticus TaxID=293890 RepID=UPI0012EC8F5A|nr:hypothetical protein [Agromyces subbeticus]
MPRILITANHLRERRGSEIVTYELAEEFALRGWHVDVYTNLFMDPMAERFAALAAGASVRVAVDPYEDFGLDYDLIWVQHSLLPPSIIRRLAEREVSIPLVWHHMSPIIEIDQPLFAEIEDHLADVRSFISVRTELALRPFGLTGPGRVFANPAPRSFAAGEMRRQRPLERLAIVSNHPPAELLDAAAVLRGDGVVVDVLGEATGSGSVEITPQLLAVYDGIVTIGKTVQYALVMGLPVYVYDHFGGPGWLDDEGFETEAEANFSGRTSFRRLSSAQIAAEIRDGYADAAAFSRSSVERFRGRYTLDRCINELLACAEIREPRVKRLGEAEALRWLAMSEQLRGMYRTIEHLQDRLAEQAPAPEPPSLPAPTAVHDTESNQGRVHVIVIDPNDQASRGRTAASIAQQTRVIERLTVIRDEHADGIGTWVGAPHAVEIVVEPGRVVLDLVNEQIAAEDSDFIVVHDGAAAWHPRFLELAIEHLDRHPVQVGVIVNPISARIEDVNGVMVDALVDGMQVQVFDEGVDLDLVSQSSVNRTRHGTLVVRRSAALGSGLFDPVLVYSAAWDFGLRVLHLGPVGVVSSRVPLVTIYEDGPAARGRAGTELTGKAFRMDSAQRLLYSSVVTSQTVFNAANGRSVLDRLAVLEREVREMPRVPGQGMELRFRAYMGRLPRRMAGGIAQMTRRSRGASA